ncbi:hypothetical protein HDU91_000452 [Kappamyces sp. JEL0680]|nr:hypothetical protein HDU91_000452 [Kappamyces sp. JEL0680]
MTHEPKTWLASAPAKVILFGEHAVVHGQACIATTVDKRTFGWATVPATLQPALVLECADLGLNYSSSIPAEPSPDQAVALEAFLMLCRALGVDSISVKIVSEIPIGAGLGSSASYSVVLSSLLLLASGAISPDLGDSDKDLINDWAFKAEKVIHGQPSGVDNTLCTFGGAKVYRRNAALRDLEGFNLEPLFLLTDTKVAKNTKRQVAMYAERLNKQPDLMNHISHAIGCISQACIDLFTRQDTDRTAVELEFAQLIATNQALLSAAGMSCAALDRVALLSQEQGLACKLTGAGGGGCALTYISSLAALDPHRIDRLEQQLRSEGMSCFQARLGVKGIQVLALASLQDENWFGLQSKEALRSLLP